MMIFNIIKFIVCLLALSYIVLIVAPLVMISSLIIEIVSLCTKKIK